MVGGFGQLPRVGVARDVSTQVSLALLLTSPSNVRHLASVLTFRKGAYAGPISTVASVRNWELKRLYIEIHCLVTDSTVSAQ